MTRTYFIVSVGTDFMDAFKTDLKKEVEKEIKKCGNLVLSGSFPSSQDQLEQEIKHETGIIEADLVKAFHKDINVALEKEIERMTKRFLHY